MFCVTIDLIHQHWIGGIIMPTDDLTIIAAKKKAKNRLDRRVSRPIFATSTTIIFNDL
jgi:hypothetical protein